MNVTEQDVLDALRAAMESPPESGETAVTVAELCATGKTEKRVREELKRLLASGRAEAVKVRRVAMDGRLATVPGYRLK